MAWKAIDMTENPQKKNRLEMASTFNKGDHVTEKNGDGRALVVIKSDNGYIDCMIPKTGKMERFYPDELINHGPRSPL
jgi:uncharacterized protein YodC (DUF2158 family)